MGAAVGDEVIISGISNNVTKSAAVIACTSLTLLYVAILYFPTLILRLPHPNSYKQFLIRRFICAGVASILSICISSSILLPIRSWKASYLLNIYCVRADNVWRPVVLPLLLTSLMYTGSLALKFLLLLDLWREHGAEGFSFNFIYVLHKVIDCLLSVASNVLAWRNYVVAPLTEEVVFRACMIPLLLCGGFKPIHVVFLCPMFFSLAHLNHILEFYYQKNYSLVRTCVAAGMQLGYTLIFGAYASFLYIRTGYLIAPLFAHIFCNFMGLPVVCSKRQGLVSLSFVVGTLVFLWLLFPSTSPDVYNSRTDHCGCWHGYCSWN